MEERYILMDSLEFIYEDEEPETPENNDPGFSFEYEDEYLDLSKVNGNDVINSKNPVALVTNAAKFMANKMAFGGIVKNSLSDPVANMAGNIGKSILEDEELLKNYAVNVPKTIISSGMQLGQQAKEIKENVSNKLKEEELYTFKNTSPNDTLKSFGKELVKGVASEVAVNTPKMASNLAYWLGTNMKDPVSGKTNEMAEGFLQLSDTFQNISEYFGEVDILKPQETVSYDGKLSWGQIGSTAGHGIGQGATMAVMARLMGPKAAYGFYALAGGADVFKESYQQDNDIGKANALAMINSASTYMIDRWFDPLPENIATGARMTAKQVTKEFGKTIVKEPLAEGLQQVFAENLVRKIGIDAEQDLFEGVVESMIGAVGGAAAMGGASTLFAYSAERHYQDAKEKAIELGASEGEIEQYRRATQHRLEQYPEVFDVVFQQNMQQTVSDINKFVKENGAPEDIRKAQQLKADLEEVYNKVYEQIKANDTDKVASAQAKVIQGIALWGSQELGISPLEYFEQRFPRIEKIAYRDFARRLNEAKRAGETSEINLYEALKNPSLLRGKNIKDTRQSLTQFLKYNGGLKDFGGELKAMDAGKQVIGLINNKNGRNLDDMALAAWEAGYFPQSSERPTVNDLLDAIQEELSGRKHYNEEAPYNLQDEINQLAEDLDRIGIDWQNMEASEIEMAVDAYMERQRAYDEALVQEEYAESEELPWFQGQIINRDTGVELTINSNEEMQGLSEEDFKNKMLDTLKSFKGNKIFNQSLNGNIEIRTSSIKKYKSFFADKNKRLIVPYIPELLEKARFASENTYTPETESNIVAYWKSYLPINIDNDTYNVYLTVKEDDKGNFFWDVQVKEKARRTVSATNPSVGGLQSPSANPDINPGVEELVIKAPRTTPATNPGDKGPTSEVSEDTISIIPIAKNVNNPLYQYQLASKTMQKAREVKAALERIASGSSEETVRNLRNDLEQYGGTNDVTFVFGDEKKGIKHIAERHGTKTLLAVFDAVVDGDISKFVKGKKTIHLSKGSVEAVLSLDENGNKKTWLLTGFDTKISPDEEREFRATLNSTQSKPTFSRQELGAELNNYIISNDYETVNNTLYQRHMGNDIFKMPTVEDFNNPVRDYELPRLNKDDLEKLGKDDKPVILKKNIIEKNKRHHPEIDVTQYNEILIDTLVDTTGIIHVQPHRKPNYYTFINENKNDVSVVELSENKDNYEIVNFFKVNKKRIDDYKKRAVKDGGEIIITKRKTQGAARLSALLNSTKDNISLNQETVNNTLYQFAGERAQTAAQDKLMRAKELAREGILQEQIRQETGWFKGVDNKWRFEISDAEAEFSLKKLNGKLGGSLPQFLKHPKLYEAYPKFRKTHVMFTSTGNELGRYNPQYNIIYLNKKESETKLKTIVLHEIQHAIQFEEGFALGSSGFNQSLNEYLRNAGEIEARNTETRMDMNEQQRQNTMPEDTQDIKNTEAIVVFDDGSFAAYDPIANTNIIKTIGQDQTLYRDPKGAYSQRINQWAIISLFERADASTFMHETAHFFFEELKAFATNSEKAARMLQTINDWLKSDGETYTLEQTEQFARGFEQYLREGKAPSNYLKRVFDAFMNWMRQLYKTATDLNVKLNDEVRNVYGEILGGKDLDKYIDAPIAEVLGNSKKYWKAKREAMDNIYMQNFKAKKDSVRLFSRGKETMQNAYTDMRNYLSDAIVPLEEEIKHILPELYNMNRRLEISKLQKTSTYYRRVKSFVDGMQKMNSADFYTFDLALKNRDVDTVQRLLEKYDLTDGFSEVRNILNDLREQMIDVGVDVAYMPDYFPRKIKDADGLLDYIEKEFGDRQEYSIIQKMIEEKRKDGRIRTKEDEAQIVNSLIRGYAGGISIAKIGNVKERSIDVVDQYMNRFYKVSTDALIDYISGAVQMIENKKYFGRETKELQNLRRMVANRETTIAEYKAMEPKEAKWKEIKTRNYKIGAVEAQIRNTYDKKVKAELQDRKTKLEAEVEFLRNRRAEQVKEIAINRMEVELAQVKKEIDNLADSKIENSVGNLLLEMAEQGKISHTQELRLKELLLARFSNQGLGNEFWRIIRDGGYIWTLGNFESAITQFGDLGTSAYKNGLWNTVFEYIKAWQGKSEITIDNLGLDKVIQDGGYADTSAWSKTLDKVLKYTGFEKMDKIAKQTLVNSAIRKAREQAKTENQELKEYLQKEFGEKWIDVKEDLKTGAITDEIIEYAMFQLLDVQPITIDQMPRYYAEGGKKRLFYMMKSYFIKQLNEYRKICFETAKSDPRKAVIDMTRLTVYLMLFNAGADVLKDLLFGREISVPDTLVDNIFIGGSINRYQALSVKREGLFKTLQKQLMFPVMLDELIVDILSDKEVKNWNTWKNIPLVGRPYYWWFGGGYYKEHEKNKKKLK